MPSKQLIYLDYAATAPLRPPVKAAMAEALDYVGNPSSVHRAGRAVRDKINAVRGALADTVGAMPGEVIFTSGGTESNAIALTQVSKDRRYASAIEHEAVLGWVDEVNRLPVTSAGFVDVDAADVILSNAAPGLVSLMLVNNATGAIQPVADIAAIAHKHGHLVHCDAVQALGKVDIDKASLGADFLSLSAHKIGGPKGMGALIVKDGFALQSLTQGGGQERRRRPGTENVLGIIGFGAALEGLQDFAATKSMKALAQQVAERAAIAASAAPRVPHIMSLHMPGVKNQLQLMRLDLEGLCVSAGSACSSGKVAGNHVLEAMGLADVADEFIRISFGPETTRAEVDTFLTAWDAIRTSQQKAA